MRVHEKRGCTVPLNLVLDRDFSVYGITSTHFTIHMNYH